VIDFLAAGVTFVVVLMVVLGFAEVVESAVTMCCFRLPFECVFAEQAAQKSMPHSAQAKLAALSSHSSQVFKATARGVTWEG
jgi:hypothetical protein